MNLFIFCLTLTLNFCVVIEGVTLACEFVEYNRGYACIVKYMEITSKDDRTVTEVIGDHLIGRSNKNVTIFKSNQQILNYFPLILARKFKNLREILIYGSSMMEINAKDLRQFRLNLKVFVIQVGNIEVLQAGLFATMTNLEEVSFAYNEILQVADGVFTNLKHLKKLWFAYNRCHEGNSIDGNSTGVMQLSAEIEKKCKEKL